jgi:hypothetical protein
MSFLMKADEWLERTESGGIGNRPKVAFMLREYASSLHLPTDKKLEMLAKIETAAGDGQRLARAHVVSYALLGLTAQKERRTLKSERAVRNWGVAKTKLTSVLNTNLGEGSRHINEAYWLEALDPRHRAWGHERADGKTAKQLLGEWMDDRQAMTFWEWCTSKGYDTLKSVQYLAPDERWRYMAAFSSGKKMLTFDGSGMSPFCTASLSTVHSGPNYAIWVASQAGAFFTHSHKLSEFHHSSLLGGRPVMCAGEWMVRDGAVLYLSHKTGHYQSPPEDLVEIVKLLDSKVDLSGAMCQLIRFGLSATTGQKAFTGVKYVMASELLRAGNARDAVVVSPQGLKDWQLASHQGGYRDGVIRAGNELIKYSQAGLLGRWEGAGVPPPPRTISTALTESEERKAQRLARAARDLARLSDPMQQAIDRCKRAKITFSDYTDHIVPVYDGSGITDWFSDPIPAALTAAQVTLDFDVGGHAGVTDQPSGRLIWRHDQYAELPDPSF